MKTLAVVFTMVLMLLALPAYADKASTIKIGVVDFNKVMQRSPQMTAINDKLQKTFKKRQEKLQAAEKKLKTEMDKFNRESSVMTVAEREELSHSITQDKREFARQQEDFEGELNIAKRKAQITLNESMLKEVEALAKAKNYDLIMQKVGLPYVSDKVDLTDQVIKRMNKKA